MFQEHHGLLDVPVHLPGQRQIRPVVGLLILSGLIARETAHYLKNDPKLRAGRAEVDGFMADQVREP